MKNKNIYKMNTVRNNHTFLQLLMAMQARTFVTLESHHFKGNELMYSRLMKTTFL